MIQHQSKTAAKCRHRSPCPLTPAIKSIQMNAGCLATVSWTKTSQRFRRQEVLALSILIRRKSWYTNPCRFRNSLIAFVACNAGLVFKRVHFINYSDRFINYSDRPVSLSCQTAIKQASQSCGFWYLSPIHIKPGHCVFYRCVITHSSSSRMDNCLLFIMTEWSVQD